MTKRRSQDKMVGFRIWGFTLILGAFFIHIFRLIQLGGIYFGGGLSQESHSKYVYVVACVCQCSSSYKTTEFKDDSY